MGYRWGGEEEIGNRRRESTAPFFALRIFEHDSMKFSVKSASRSTSGIILLKKKIRGIVDIRVDCFTVWFWFYKLLYIELKKREFILEIFRSIVSNLRSNNNYNKTKISNILVAGQASNFPSNFFQFFLKIVCVMTVLKYFFELLKY